MPGLRKPLADDSSSLLQVGALGGRQGNVLLIRHPDVSWPDCSCVERGPQSFGRAMHLTLGAVQDRESILHCRSAELPFQECAFRRVVLWHVISSGREPELSEACRVLAPGGEILILGINPYGLRVRLESQARGLPRLRRAKIAHELQELSMVTDAVYGAGFMGLSINPGGRPVQQGRLSGLLLPIVDLLMIRAQPADNAPMNALRLDQFRAGVAPTT